MNERENLVLLLAEAEKMQKESETPEVFRTYIKYLRKKILKCYRDAMKNRV